MESLDNKLVNQVSSPVVDATAWYLGLVKEWTTILCFFELQETGLR